MCDVRSVDLKLADDHLDIMMEKGPDGHLMTPCRPHKRQCYEISEGEEIEEKVEPKSLESKLVDKPKAATDAVKAPLGITSALLHPT